MNDPTGGKATGQMAAIQTKLQETVGDTYAIERMLGRGGMGAVFLARERKLDRHVAIKVLPPGLSFDEEFSARFVREARTAAKLDHPNIVPIYSVEDEGDLLFFCMKYVPGTDLSDEMAKGPADIDRIQKVIWESACALGHAHQRGVVHRDVKPANIMIDEAGRPLLTDFGISKAASADTQYTATGQMIGTPTYMSPEQAKGLSVDGRTDQYALGVVGYQMLAGRLPFTDDSVHQLIYKQIYQDPDPITTIRPDCPDFLAEAVHRAMQKEPMDRFDTMEAFATAVWPEHPVEAASPPRLHNIRVHEDEDRDTFTKETPILAGTAGRRRKNRLIKGFGGTAALAVVGLGAWAVLTNEPAPPIESGGIGVATSIDSGAANVGLNVVDSNDSSTQASAGSSTQTPDSTPSAPVTTPTPVAVAPETQQPAAPTTGFLTVIARPWGTVYIDGVELRDSPITRHELSLGRYVIEIRRVGYVTAVDTVDITPGNPTRRTYILIEGQ